MTAAAAAAAAAAVYCRSVQFDPDSNQSVRVCMCVCNFRQLSLASRHRANSTCRQNVTAGPLSCNYSGNPPPKAHTPLISFCCGFLYCMLCNKSTTSCTTSPFGSRKNRKPTIHSILTCCTACCCVTFCIIIIHREPSRRATKLLSIIHIFVKS